MRARYAQVAALLRICRPNLPPSCSGAESAMPCAIGRGKFAMSPHRLREGLRGRPAKRACKPDPVSRRTGTVVIYLVLPLPGGIVRPTRGRGRAPSSEEPEASLYLALLREGLASIPARAGTWCALTAPFHPCLWPERARAHRRCRLCGAFRRLAAPGRYPAPCPMESGLSSPVRNRSDHPALLALPVYPWRWSAAPTPTTPRRVRPLPSLSRPPT